MIPPELALLAWIGISFLLTVAMPGYKAFTWSFLLAMFFLPSNLPNDLQVVGLPDITKVSAVTYGMMPATFLFHLHKVRLARKWDLLLLVMLASVVQTALENEQTLYDGVSNALSYFVELVAIIFLLRVHVRDAEHGRYFLRSLVVLGSLYAPLLLWEWRMSPQLHTEVYGYFPHQFLQMARWGFYRPLGFFPHALDTAYAYAIILMVAYGFMRNREKDFPIWLLAGPALGLVFSMSMGPYFFAFGGIVMLELHARKKIRLWWSLLPFILIGIALYFCENHHNFDFMVQFAAWFSYDRAESLLYRLEAFELYIQNIVNRPWFGHSTHGRGRIEGLATDSSLLIYLLSYGYVFTGLLYGWYLSLLENIRRQVNKTAGSIETADFVGAACYWALWLCVVYNFVVEGTALLPLMMCCGFVANLKEADAVAAAEEDAQMLVEDDVILVEID